MVTFEGQECEEASTLIFAEFTYRKGHPKKVTGHPQHNYSARPQDHNLETPCVQTACQWLIKLGWHNTLMKKGVYMDGHGHADVVEYQQQVFLPVMAEFERWMAHYEGPELKQVAPNLALGECEIIPNFHNKSSFHANEESCSAWL